MRTRLMLLAALTLTLGLAATAQAGCWCGNGYSDATTNFVEAQVWPGDPDGLGTLTSMEFVYTTDGSDPKTSGTAQSLPGIFYQFHENNDWYQAWLTANNGDLVRWYVISLSFDQETCESDEFSFTSGVAVPDYPNLVGDCESELGLPGGDWNNGDPESDMTDPDMDGIFSVTLTAAETASFGGGGGYQVVGDNGLWSPQYPGDANIPISFTQGDVIEFFLDTNAMAGWAPETNAVSDSFLAADTHSWAAVGTFQGWDPANPATQMAAMGGGIYMVSVPFTADMFGTHEFKCAADGGWDLQCGVNGYSSGGATWFFDVNAEVYVEFYFHVSGRIKVVVTDVVANEDMSWSKVKDLYR